MSSWCRAPNPGFSRILKTWKSGFGRRAEKKDRARIRIQDHSGPSNSNQYPSLPVSINPLSIKRDGQQKTSERAPKPQFYIYLFPRLTHPTKTSITDDDDIRALTTPRHRSGIERRRRNLYIAIWAICDGANTKASLCSGLRRREGKACERY